MQPISLLDESPATYAPRSDAGFGALRTERGCLPLVSLDVRGTIVGLHAQTHVQQAFRNTFAEPLEATYIFPLPDRAAVTSFRMLIGERIIDGVLKERGQARADYEQAIEDGHRAAIAEEERSGTFSLRVGNLPPGEEARVELTLVGPLDCADGEATYRFPLVVAPRYVPGMPLAGPSVGLGTALDTNQVPDASRVTPPVLLPGFPNPVQLSVEVEIESENLIARERLMSELRSTLHSVVIESGTTLRVRLQPGERLNRDFVLRFPVASEKIGTALKTTWSGNGPGTFALTLVPPRPKSGSQPRPRDIVFVLDRSGSMEGWKIVAARRALERMIDGLSPRDRFSVLAFDSTVEYAPCAMRRLADATFSARTQALAWLQQIDARGGTEMGPAILSALDLLPDESRERTIVFLTDGQVAGEDVLLKTLSGAQGHLPRIFTVGIDQAVNQGFLQRLAEIGHGRCAIVENEERLDAMMQQMHRLIDTPVLTDLQLEPRGLAIATDTLAPARLPDVFAASPVVIYGRFTGDPRQASVLVRARDSDGQPFQCEVAASPTEFAGLKSLWGRVRVRELEDRYAAGGGSAELAAQIVEVSLDAGVLSRFTAYVAIDHSEVVNEGGEARPIVQPVEIPNQWGMAMRLSSVATLACAAPAMHRLAFQARELAAGRGVLRKGCSAEPESAAHKARRRLPAKGGFFHSIFSSGSESTWEGTLKEAKDACQKLAAATGRRRRKCLAKLLECFEALQRLAPADAVRDVIDRARKLMAAKTLEDEVSRAFATDALAVLEKLPSTVTTG